MGVGFNTYEVLPHPTAIMLNIDWTQDRKICIFQPTITHPIAIDIWHDAVHKTMMQWPTGKPFRVLHDFSLNKHFNLTLRLKMRVLRHFFGSPELTGRAAILIQRTVGSETLSLFYH